MQTADCLPTVVQNCSGCHEPWTSASTPMCLVLLCVWSSGQRSHVLSQADRACLPQGSLRSAVSGDLSREITLQTANQEFIFLPEKVEVIEQCLRAIRSDALQPVVVFDGTDRWIDSGHLARLLERRVRGHTAEPAGRADVIPLTGVLTESAVDALYRQYRTSRSLRAALQIAHAALVEAADAGAAAIGGHHIEAATQAW